jgi:hypothetical protein
MIALLGHNGHINMIKLALILMNSYIAAKPILDTSSNSSKRVLTAVY